jgi:hypothetical protein
MSSEHITRLVPETQSYEGRSFGRHIEHDPRSFAFAHGVLPRPVIKSQQWTRRIPILNQGNVGSCTANASTGWVGTDNAWRQGLTAVENIALDEAWALRFYEIETRLDGIPGEYPPDDTGSSGLAAGKTLHKLGLVSKYLHAFSLSSLEAALQNGPVLLGLPWHSDMMDADADGNVQITGDIVGGHELCADGLDVEGKRVKISNSWGAEWGNQGTFWLTFDQLEELLDDSGDVTIPIV